MNFSDYKIVCSLYVKGILQDFLQIPKPTTTTTKTVGLKPGGVLLCMGPIGMCRCEGYGFQAVYSSIGYINQSVWV